MLKQLRLYNVFIGSLIGHHDDIQCSFAKNCDEKGTVVMNNVCQTHDTLLISVTLTFAATELSKKFLLPRFVVFVHGHLLIQQKLDYRR